MHTKYAALVALTVVLGCTTAQPPAGTVSQFKNLQVLPQDIPRDQLIATMRSFTRSLGVKCNECHVVIATEPEEQLDFAADAKEEKRVARVMIRMSQQINGQWMEAVERAEGDHETQAAGASETPSMKVTCWTCHRGKTEPDTAPPA